MEGLRERAKKYREIGKDHAVGRYRVASDQQGKAEYSMRDWPISNISYHYLIMFE